MKKFKDIKKGEFIYVIEESINGDCTVRPEKVLAIKTYNDCGKLCFELANAIYNRHNYRKNIWLSGNWSRDGLICASEDIANNFIEKTLKKKKLFATLKPGDNIYLAHEKYDDTLKLTIHSIDIKQNEIFLKNAKENTKKACFFIDEHNFYSNKASVYSWHLYNIVPKEWGRNLIARVFIELEDAEKYIASARERIAKKAINKYVEDLSNLGKKISLTDNKGNELHYGDKVAYVRRNGIHSHTDISIGTVVGESKTKIKIVDEQERKKGKQAHDYDCGIVESDGLHALERQNVLFISPGENKMLTFAK